MLKRGLALISCSLIFIFGFSSSEVERVSTANWPYNMKPSGPLSIFIPLVKKGSDKGALYFHQVILHSRTPRIAKFPFIVIRDDSLEVVGIVRFVRIQSIRVVICWLLMYTSTLEKNDCKISFTWATRRIRACCSSSTVASASAFAFPSWYFLLLLQCKCRNHDAWPNSVSKLSTSVLNQRKIPICLKLRIIAIFIEWGRRINFLFVGWQDIVN